MTEPEAWAAHLPPHEETAPMDKIDTSTALLPCPFCGGDDIQDWGESTWSRPVKWMYCGECQACGPRVMLDRGESQEAWSQRIHEEWNRRALVPALIAERDDLRAKLDAAVEALDRIGGLPYGNLLWRHTARATLAKIKGADHE